jgi:glucose-6-phosphate dehydrogenase assembly protein OpcA
MSHEHTELATRTFVDVHAILEELEQVRWGLHEDGGGASEAEQHAANEARASVLNLITVVSEEATLGSVSHVLDGLSITNPSRTLILLAQDDRVSDKLEAEVSAQERTESGHRVSTERVLLHAHGDVARHLASLATPLLIPDLPVILWWPGRPNFDNTLFNDLCELADRLVVDTDDGFDDASLRRLLDVARRDRARAEIGDFNWARLIAWRHIAAQFFDMPGMLAKLAGIHGVTIFYGTDGSTMQARLLGGWIRSRLASVGIDVPLELRPDDSFEHGVCRFLIYTSGDDGTTRFSISRLPGGRLCAEIRIGDQDFAPRTVRMSPRSAEELLAIELLLPGHDVLFEQALAAALA